MSASACELAFVYTVTMGTMLGTAGLFFASGIVLGLVAFLIIRIEKRMNAEPASRRSRSMMTGNRIIVAALVVALAQIGFLGWIIAGRAAILRDGREIVLKVEPVDPRDLLRGDYVRLGYEISSIPVSKITNLPPDKIWSDASDALCAGEEGRRRLLASCCRRLSTRRRRRRRARRGRHQGHRSRRAGTSAPARRSSPTTASTASICRKARGWICRRTCGCGRSAFVSRWPPTAPRRSRRCWTATSHAFRGAALLGGE